MVHIRHVPALLVAIGVALFPMTDAGEITLSLVTARGQERLPLDQFSELRRSPYGGWVVTLWPFGMKVDDASIFEYRSELLEEAWKGIDAQTEGDKDADSDDAVMQELGIQGPPVMPDISRPSTTKINLNEGDHVLMPGEIRFSIRQGRLSSDDPRVRIDAAADLVEILCYPVTLRALDDVRSVAAPMSITYAGVDLTAGVLKLLEDPEKRKRPQEDQKQGDRARFRRIVLYCPPTSGEGAYYLNGVPFRVTPDGKARMDPTNRIERIGDAELRLRIPAPPPERIVGMRRLHRPISASLPDHPEIPVSAPGSEMATLRVPPGDKTASVVFARDKQNSESVTFLNTFDEFPYKVLLFDPPSGLFHLFETAQFTVPPGGDYSCRLTPIGRQTKPGKELPCRLECLYSRTPSMALNLSGPGTGTYSARIPAQVTSGLWQIVHAGASPLRGYPLGLILVTEQKSPTVVTLYTCRNRSVFLRGDPVDLFWTVRQPEGGGPPPSLDVELVGTCHQRTIATIRTTPQLVASGHTRIDTSGLAPGIYQLRVRPGTTISYPAHFFLTQREPLSDFGINSYSPFGDAAMDAGSPINTYYGQGTGANEPGLEPVADWARSGLDSAYAVYVTSPAAPAIEKFLRPAEDEIGLMTLARLGKKAVLQMPGVLHHEDWNPKHTLPEELHRMRRRNALFTQKYVDVAGFSGIHLNWFATLHGYWEESKPLDGNQARRNAEAGRWVQEQVARRVEAEKPKNPDPDHLAVIQKQANYEFWSLILPTAYQQYLADAHVIRPGLTSHSGIPSFWLGGNASYPPLAYSTITHRDCVDYTDYCRPPWSEFRAPAFLNLDNPQRQKTQMSTAAAGRHARFIVAFGGAGRGLDGFAFPSDRQPPPDDHLELLRIFERYGSYFTALEPLPDVAVYFSRSTSWAHRKSIILHDLARLRRPGVLLAAEDILRGELDKYRVLFLAAVGTQETAAIRSAFTRFHERGGIIIKDGNVAKTYPGVELGFAYDQKHVHGGWGLGGPDGEWEFAHLWVNFLEGREPFLLKAFEKAPPSPVSTSDKEIVISPLGGKESICCFVINQTYVPMSVPGKWRQHVALPRKGDLVVEKGWYVRDLLTGKPCAVVEKSGRNTVEMDFAQAEGKVFLLTRREPKSMAIRTESTPSHLDLAAWLEDGEGRPLPDPMPFEVTLSGPDGSCLFRRYAALSPDGGLSVPVPSLEAGARLQLTVTDLVLGSSAVQAVQAAPMPGRTSPAAEEEPIDTIGRDQIGPFLHERKGRVVILIDEGQRAYRPAADAAAALLRKNGRDVKLVTLDAAEVREVPLRWHWTDEDKELLAKISAAEMVGWRVALSPFDKEFTDPLCGFEEYGPRTWIEGDVVMFGGPEGHRGLEEIREFLRRVPSRNYPSPGRFFIHYVWDPFFGECDALYIGCNDPAGAEAAVQCLSQWKKGGPKASADEPARTPQVIKGGTPKPVEDMLTDRFGTRILDVAYAPSGRRIFLTLDSYGDSFFVLDSDGKVIQSRPIGNRLWHSIWFSGGGALRPLSDDQTFVRIGDNDFLLSLEKGFISKTDSPPHGLPGRVRVGPGGPVLYQDHAKKRAYLGGKCALAAVDADGRLLWRYDDAAHRTSTGDMLHRRSIFIRGVTPNGKRLLATAFGVAQDVYGIGSPQNQSVFCVDTDSGKVLWAKDGLYLNQGKAILTDDRFVIVDDDGRFHLVKADTGESAGNFRAVEGTDVLLPIPGTDLLLVVENNQFDRDGPTARSYLRGPGDGADIHLKLPGRMRNAVLTPDGKSVILSSVRGQTACFGLDGSTRWTVAIPAGGAVRFSPDGATTLVGSAIGKLFTIDSASGNVIRITDFNPFNTTSPEQFVKQMSNVGDVPVARAARVPPPAPQPSYIDSLDKKAVRFGPNLIPGDRFLGKAKAAEAHPDDPARPKCLGRLEGQVQFTLKVEPRSTYLVEFLNAAVEPAKLPPQARLEVMIRGNAQGKHLPFTGRLPIGRWLARRRMAFRTDSDTEVVLSLRTVMPTKPDASRRSPASYEPGETADFPVLLGDLVVAAIQFSSRNFLRGEERSVEAMASAQGEKPPRGWIECRFFRWSGGDSTFKKWDWYARQTALRLTDGIIGNQETKWQEASDAVTGLSINYGTARTTFKTPETITAVAVYEENRGPALLGDSVQEMTSMHYGIYVNGQRVGYAVDNTNLVNIFTFPPVKTGSIDYFWAGREFTHLTDGMIRTAELEAYSTEEADMGLDDAGERGEKGAEGEGLDIEINK